MSRPGKAARTSAPSKVSLHLRLYICGNAPNSVRATANLDAIRREYLGGQSQVEIVDVLKEPLRALEDGILLTPTLVRSAPPPTVKIVGDLSDKARVLQALGMTERTS